MKRTGIHLSPLQKRIIAVFVLLIVVLSILFFLPSKGKVWEEANDIKSRGDDLSVTKYSGDSILAMAKSSKTVDSQLLSGSNSDSAVVVEKESIDKAVDMNNSYREQSKSITQQEERKKTDRYQNTVLYQDLNVYGNINEYQASSGQSDNTISTEEIKTLLSHYNKDESLERAVPANSINQTPKPINGDKAFNDYVNKDRKELIGNDCENLHGKVILLFKVNSKGRPVDIAILRSLCKAADNEAVRLLQSGPNWTASNNFAQTEIAF
jgi:hypothetical protein